MNCPEKKTFFKIPGGGVEVLGGQKINKSPGNVMNCPENPKKLKHLLGGGSFRGSREGGDREGEREREAGREGGARAKPGNQLVYYKALYCTE